MISYCYISYPQNVSCTAQPCLTFTELRDEFFAPNNAYNETITSGDTYLVFMPGTHYILATDEDIIGVGGVFSLSGSVYDPPPTIECESVFSGIDGIDTPSGIYFSNFSTIELTNLRFINCVVYVWQDGDIVVDRVVFDSFLDIRNVDSVNITDTSAAGLCDSLRNDVYGVFNFNFSQTVTFTNVSLLTDQLPCSDILKLVTFNTGDFTVVDSTFVGVASHVILRNATFGSLGQVCFENGRTAIQAHSSAVNLAGNISFTKNTGYQGGAISLTDTLVTITDNAHVIFEANRAEFVGGAIYDSGSDVSDYVSIGQTIGLPTIHSCPLSFGANSRVEFVNNLAESGGSAMYGIALSRAVCTDGLDPESILNGSLVIEPDDFSAVSSDPLRVCICLDQSTPDCLAILPDQNFPHLHYSVYPGQTFTIPVAVVGFNFAVTSGSVYAQFLGNSDAFFGLRSQQVQNDNSTGCSPLQYSVLSNKKEEMLVLTTNRRNVTGVPRNILRDVMILNNNMDFINYDTSQYNYISNSNKYYVNGTFVTNLTDGMFRLAGYLPRPLQDTPVFVSVTLLECPPGFTLSAVPYKCVCSDQVLENNLTCNINDQTVQREGTTWVNASYSGNSSNGVIVHLHCPFGYCKREIVDVKLTNPDTQCSFNHSGTLCGACKPNFSLALGGNRCLPNCSNSYLLLLIPFILAGFGLVLFIKILNLTVSQGAINGLIFYANIVAANKSILFPTQYNPFLSFLFVFISWLNLDFGYDTCFIEGLDAYWKTWLQFVFPFYVWAIAGVIILLSHYSRRVTRLFGTNSLSVLATLFLLSYAKILRTIITIFGFTALEYPDNSRVAIWAFDGNIQYFSPKHVPLFLFAFVTIFLLWLPYTTILLAALWLRTKTHRKGLRWLKPFLDAYYGPFKDKHHYWVGVLLVVRGVLFVFFASFLAVENNVNLLLISVTCVSLLSFPGSMYKVVYLTALENSFFLNLGVLAAGTFYNILVGGSQQALVTISVGIVFFQFLGIAFVHGYYFIIKPNWPEWKAFFKSRYRQGSTNLELSTPLVVSKAPVTHTEVCLHKETAADASLDPDAKAPHEGSETAADHQYWIRSNSDSTAASTDGTADRTIHSEQTGTADEATGNDHTSQQSPKYFSARSIFASYTSPRESLLFVQ